MQRHGRHVAPACAYPDIVMAFPPEFVQALTQHFFRPPPVFEEHELATLLAFVRASGIRPEGAGGGRFDLDTRPYLRPLYEERRAHPFRRLVIMKAAQMGLTVKLIYRAAWLTADARQRINTALMFPTLDAVLDLHKSRFRPMMRSSSKVMRLVDGLDAVGLVRFGASTMRFRGMRSGIGVDSFPADALLFDEVRLMDLATIERVFVRVSESSLMDPHSGARGLIELNSTAGFPNMDIHRWFLRSTQNYWRTPCPNARCRHHKHGLVLPLHWPDCVGHHQGRLYYQCPTCHTPIEDAWLLGNGFYLAENPTPDTADGVAWEGYQFSQIMKGNRFLPELWQAYTRGDNLSEFWNSRMGLPYQDPDAVPATRAVVEACIDPTGSYRWPHPDTLQGEYVAMGIDQRASEKHVVMYKHGPGGLIDLVHVEVVEASGNEAAGRLEQLFRRYHCKICVIDGAPSYDLAVELGRRLPGRVWLASYGEERPHIAEWLDDRGKASVRRSSGEARYEYRVLIDRYKGLDRALTLFARGRVRLPADFYERRQERTIAGVRQPVSVGREFIAHLENIARATIPRTVTLPTGETVLTGDVRRIYRDLSFDPHYAHAHLYAITGLDRTPGGATMHLGPSADAGAVLPKQQLEHLPLGARPSDLLRELDRATTRTCGNCAWRRSLADDRLVCGHPHHQTPVRLVREALPACPHYRRQR